MSAPLEGAVPSPNIWEHPDVYETENSAVDPDGTVWEAMRQVHDWAGARVLDVGCGTGYHLPQLARRASQVVGVEPHPGLVARARERVRDAAHVRVLQGTAQALPLKDASIDVVHARWAYFFGPGCEPGLAELARVLAPGGTAFVLDNDTSRSTFGGWFRRAWPAYDQEAVDRFWRRHGWSATPLELRWEFAERADLEAVVRIELPPRVAAMLLAEHDGLTVDYAAVLRHRRH